MLRLNVAAAPMVEVVMVAKVNVKCWWQQCGSCTVHVNMQLIRRRRLGRRRRRRRRRRRHCHHRRRQLQHRVRSTARVVDVMPVSVSWMHGCCLGERVGLTVVRANCELQSHSVQSSATGSKFNSSPTRRRRFQTVKAGRWRLAGWRWSLSCCLSGGVAVTALVRLRRRHSLPAAARQREREKERKKRVRGRCPRGWLTRHVVWQAQSQSVSQSRTGAGLLSATLVS